MKFLVGTFILGLFLDFSKISLHAAERIRVGFPSLATALSPTWVTSKKGFWKKNGLDVELIYLSGGITVPSLLGGSVQVIVGSDTEATIAMIKGLDLVRLGVTTNSLGSSLVTQQNVGSFGQLKGKTIGIGSRVLVPWRYDCLSFYWTMELILKVMSNFYL
jgi:ABC-type nitrate/sulfonate/bicarbonate transport system substrate-binding protein